MTVAWREKGSDVELLSLKVQKGSWMKGTWVSESAREAVLEKQTHTALILLAYMRYVGLHLILCFLLKPKFCFTTRGIINLPFEKGTPKMLILYVVPAEKVVYKC